MADTIQKRGGYIPGIRPWRETAEYINDVLMHLSLRGWFWLGILGIYSYVLNYIPFIQQISQQLWSLPVVVTWSWVIIIVWVVQDVINKVKTEMLLHKYDTVE
jgi:preprotein translocase subunit SecY